MVAPSSNGGPQVCEIGDWKNIPQASRKNSSVSPFGAPRLMGRLANFHAWPSGDFPVSDFPDLRTTTVPYVGQGYVSQRKVSLIYHKVSIPLSNPNDPLGLL